MKRSLSFLLMLLTGAATLRVEAQDEARKPLVYDYVGNGADRTNEAVYRSRYSKKFRIVDAIDDRAYTDPKPLDKGGGKPPVRDRFGNILTGEAVATFIVDANGRVIDPFIIRSTDSQLNEPVLQAVEESRFKPARLSESPIAAIKSRKFVFTKPALPRWLERFPNARAIDARGVKHSLAETPPYLDDVTNKVVPENPSSTTRAGGAGQGLFRVSIDVTTGRVTDVTVLQPIESASLHPRIVTALWQWRWKPGTWRQVDIPFAYGPGAAAGGQDHDPFSGFPKASPVYPGGLVP